MKAGKKPLVSVCIITYNQENYIAPCINGVLEQRADFEFEILIGDDHSTDSTPKICEEFMTRFPEKIKLIKRPKNLGMIGNWVDTIQSCNGKYIGICEGDDYWIDPLKLQKQIDFLEANEDYAICFHRVYELVDGKEPALSTLNNSLNQETYTIEDLAKNNFIHTPSVVFRNRGVNKLPSWFQDSPIGDYVLHMLNAQHGKIKYLPEPMAVYRRHSGGVWSTKDYRTSLIKFNWVKRKLDIHFAYKYHHIFFSDDHKLELVKTNLEHYKKTKAFFPYMLSAFKLVGLKRITIHSFGFCFLLFRNFFKKDSQLVN